MTAGLAPGLLVALLGVPLAGAAVLALLPASADRAARLFGVAFSALTFAVSLALIPGAHGPRGSQTVDPFRELDLAWVPAIGLRFHLGVDGVSLPLVLLTTLLTLLCSIYTLHSLPPPGRAGTMLSLVLLLEAGMLGTFVALDLLLFFLFFEVVLAPMYFLIAVWGGERARSAAMKFVLYTLLGSVLLLVGILTVYASAGTLDIVALSQRHGSGIACGAQVGAFLAMFLGFAVKSPLWPLHTWLPDAHTEAPTIGSVLLAGVLLKMGTYGLVRVALPVVPYGARTLAPALAVLAVAGIVVGALCCFAQTELKRLIAYSSVGHMGFVLLGIATLTTAGVQAALIGNIAHGIITGLLFFLVGGIKDRFHTADLAALGGGLTARLPVLGSLLTLTAIASLGLPGLASFWGESFAVVSAFGPAADLPRTLYVVLGVLAALGAALAAVYFLRMLRRVTVGPAPPGARPAVHDAGVLELVSWVPLVVLTLVVGLWPRLVLGLTEEPVRALLAVFGT